MSEDIRSITLLNGTGDLTISWTKREDRAMRDWIDSKIEAGYTFFTMPDTFLGRVATLYRKQEISHSSDAIGRTVYIDDPQLEALYSNGTIAVQKTPDNASNIESTGYARTTDAVINSRCTAAVRPIAGG